MLEAIHHVQLAIAPGTEDTARAFYGDVLGMTERPKPPILAARGGCWFQSEGGVEIHLGVEDPFVPAKKAHPGILVADIDVLAAQLAAHGYDAAWDDSIPGRRRFHTFDPHGNRLEFIQS
jgi:catechol 2,3-dioxygenase-like lactoylglutathione lyase family enzyme